MKIWSKERPPARCLTDKNLHTIHPDLFQYNTRRKRCCCRLWECSPCFAVKVGHIYMYSFIYRWWCCWLLGLFINSTTDHNGYCFSTVCELLRLSTPYAAYLWHIIRKRELDKPIAFRGIVVGCQQWYWSLLKKKRTRQTKSSVLNFIFLTLNMGNNFFFNL